MSKHLVLVAMFMLVAIVGATPPGIAKNPSNARCLIKKYKMCYNLEHVCPKFCPDSCTVNCVSCKPVCGPGTPTVEEPPSSSPPPAIDYTPPVFASPPPPISTPAPTVSTSPPPPVTTPTPPISASPPPPVSTPAPAPPLSASPPPPVSTPAPTVSTSPPPPVTTPTPPVSASPPPPVSTPAPAPSLSASPPPPVSTPAPSVSASPPPPISTLAPPVSASPPPPVTTPTPPVSASPPPPVSTLAPPVSTSPPSPTVIPPPPEFETSPETAPPTPTPSSPYPTPPTTPTASPPTYSPPQSPKKVKCKNKNFPQCFNMEHTCPSACPGGCEVDCVTCKPVCKCDMPGAVCQDPRFIGGDGLTFYFHGKKDQDFCLVTDNNLHINAHFIGRRNQDMKRDFTWVQSLGILFNNHKLSIAAQKTLTWDDLIDRLSFSFDGKTIYLPNIEGAKWESEITPTTSIIRVADTNNVIVEVEGMFKITAKAVPITEEESRVHNYGITKDDSFAHLDLGFKFVSLSDVVNGVLGQTYRGDYVSKAKMNVAMPVLGGEREFASSSLFATDCSVSMFTGVVNEASSLVSLELPRLNCASGMDGKGVVCKR